MSTCLNAPDKSSLTGRRALITGAARGLGHKIAGAFHVAGAHVVATVRKSSDLDALQAEFGCERFEVHYLDLADLGGVDRFAQGDVIASGVDILVNNAALQGPIGPIDSNAFEDWTACIAVNLIAPAALIRAVLPAMRERNYGRIINISGGGAAGSRPNFTAYAAAKTGLVRLTECVAEEVRDLNITVNAVAPGAMSSAMTAAVLEAGPELAGCNDYAAATRLVAKGADGRGRAVDLCVALAAAGTGVSGRLIAAQWDPWSEFDILADIINKSDVYTLRRIVPKDRGDDWGG